MSYRIQFDGAGSTAACARSPLHALELAELFASKGKTNVVIGGPDGEVLPMGRFRMMLRHGPY